MRHAEQFVTRGLGPTAVRVAQELDRLKQHNPYGSNTLPRPEEIERVKHSIGSALSAYPSQLAEQVDQIVRTGHVDQNKLDLTRALLEAQQLVSRYRTAGGLPPAADATFNELRELHGKSQTGSILRGVIGPAAEETER